MSNIEYRNGRRVAIALACWLFGSIGVLSSLMFFGTAVSEFAAQPGNLSATDIGLLIPIAWLALAVMTKAWVQNSRAHFLWIVLGLFTGLPLAILFIPFLMFYFTLVGFAFYLVFWHLSPKQRSIENA